MSLLDTAVGKLMFHGSGLGTAVEKLTVLRSLMGTAVRKLSGVGTGPCWHCCRKAHGTEVPAGHLQPCTLMLLESQRRLWELRGEGRGS